MLRVRLKHDASTRFFQCTLHALVRDGQEQGICVLARDITRERENEARFTELFETLQEGVYLATADGKFEDVNPALARMLGYENREELLDRPLSDFLLAARRMGSRTAPNWLSPARSTAMKSRCAAATGRRHLPARRRSHSRYRGPRPPPSGNARRHHRTPGDRNSACTANRNSRAAWWKVFPIWWSPSIAKAATRLSAPRSRELLGFAPEEMIGTRLGERMDPRDRKEVRALVRFDCSGQCAEGSIEYLHRTQRRRDAPVPRHAPARFSTLRDISTALSPPRAISPKPNAWSSN